MPENADGRTAVWMAAVLVALVMLAGCGKKGPPVAPEQTPLVGVRDLHGSLNSGLVRLTWNHVPDNARAAGYIVLRAQRPLSQLECPGCPVVFQKVESIPINRSLRKERHDMASEIEVVPGFRYTFNVRPYEPSGSQGPDANMVVIEYADTAENGAVPPIPEE